MTEEIFNAAALIQLMAGAVVIFWVVKVLLMAEITVFAFVALVSSVCGALIALNQLGAA